MGTCAITTQSLSTPTKSPASDKALRPILKRKTNSASSNLLGSARPVVREVTSKPKPDMAAAFLQYCAMCEKQIMTPCNSILYCSEACRRKDSAKPLAAAIITTPPTSPPLEETSSSSSSPRHVLTPRLPTGVTPSSPHSSDTSIPQPAHLHDHSSDLDPTEWKPSISKRTDSEAYHYLSRFYSSTSEGGNGRSSSLRTPSLGTTPTTTPSSSLSSSAGLAGSHSHLRPLPTRQNRWYAFNSGITTKGVDLVTPHVVPDTPNTSRWSTGMDYDDGTKWEKRKVMFASTAPENGDDGLSVLFGEQK